MKYFELVNLVEGHGFKEVIPDSETNPNVYISAVNETELRYILNEFGKKYSNDFEIYASFDDGVADIWYNNKDWKLL